MTSSNFIYGKRTSGGQQGDVFTNPYVVKYMLDLVGYNPDKDLSTLSIMEPSCGEGEFLVEILHRLQLSAELFGFDLNEAYHKCVHASDIDADKIEKCLNRLNALFPTIIHPEENIKAEDYLLNDQPLVDIVIGNPPYIRYEQIPTDKLPIYKKRFPTFYYRADMYVLFYEKSLRQLNPHGCHCFICSNRWMRNKYGNVLRKMVAQSFRIEQIINMEGADAFQEDVLAYPAVTLFSNNKQSENFLYSEISSVSQLRNAETFVHPCPNDEDWSCMFAKDSSHDLFPLIEEQGFKIGIGVATGADGIFISHDLKGKIEDSLLLPAIHGQDLRANQMNWNGRMLFNPYDKNGELINLDSYPLCKAYLESHRKALSNRAKAKHNPSKWYGTIDRIYPALQHKAKILLPDISGNTFIFVDEGNYYPLHNIYYIIGGTTRQLYLLAAILMSDFARGQLASLTNHMNGGYPRWQSQYLKKLRVPVVSSIPEELADKLLQSYQTHNITEINYYVSLIIENGTQDSKGKARKQKPTQLQLAFD